MSEIKCLVCKSSHFKEGYYDLNATVDVYIHGNKELYTEAYSNVESDFRLKSKGFTDDFAEVYKYVCENCGYIMSFTKEKEVKSRKQKKEQQQKESGYDWTNFGKDK